MRLNLKIDQTQSVEIRNKKYPISISGSGVPCLVIGIGTLMQRTLSKEFKKSFKIYSSDLYWIQEHSLDDPLSLNLNLLIDDIEELRKNLGLSSYTIIAHSAYGIVALEYAKKYPAALKGIVMIGTPLNSNAEIAAHNNQHFESHADPLRKRIDLERREKFAHEDLSDLDATEKFLKEYIWKDAPRYWHDPIFDCTPLWKGINIDGQLLKHFFNAILPKVDAQKNLDKIGCPVFLAAGMSDYDCCPWRWSEINNFSNLTVSLFNQSGHYPNYEEVKLFDERVKSWAQFL